MNDERFSPDTPVSPRELNPPPRPDMPELPPTRVPTIPPVLRSLIGLLVLLLVYVGTLLLRGDIDLLFRLYTWQNLLHTNRELAIVALGMLLVIIAGGIDLSIGSVVALVGVCTMKVYILLWGLTQSTALASIGSIGAGLLVGSLCGTANGLSITYLRVSPFVTTLGMMSIARGVAMWVAERSTVPFPEGARPSWIVEFQRPWSNSIILNPGVWSIFVLALVVALLLRYTVFGRYCYAIGSNEATAELCGIPVQRYKIGVYALSGLFAAWAGILFFTKLATGDPTVGGGLELDAIAAVVLGGASLSGGRGTVLGTVLGMLLLALLGNLVGLLNAPLELKYILIGGILIAYTALNQWQQRDTA